MSLIGLSGPIGSGKSTIAQMLVESSALGLFSGVRLLGFSEPLKRAAVHFIEPFDIPDQYWAWTQEDKDRPVGNLRRADGAPLTLRYLLKTLGTEWGRGLIHSEFWIELAMVRVAAERAKGYELIVFDDCRFTNEAQAIRDAGGAVWHVSGRAYGGAEASGGGHASETERCSAAFQSCVTDDIDNSGSRARLAEQVEAALLRLARPKKRVPG